MRALSESSSVRELTSLSSRGQQPAATNTKQPPVQNAETKKCSAAHCWVCAGVTVAIRLHHDAGLQGHLLVTELSLAVERAYTHAWVSPSAPPATPLRNIAATVLARAPHRRGTAPQSARLPRDPRGDLAGVRRYMLVVSRDGCGGYMMTEAASASAHVTQSNWLRAFVTTG